MKNKYYVIVSLLLNNREIKRAYTFDAVAVSMTIIDIWRRDISRDLDISIQTVMVLSWQMLDC